MQHIKVPYGTAYQEADLPDQIPVQVINPTCPRVEATAETLIEAALDHPIGSPRLEELARPEDHVLLIVNDQTRPGPNAEMAAAVVRRLNGCGVPDSQITILIATGSHRAPTDAELTTLVGRDLMQRIRVVSHDCKQNNVCIGNTESGVPLYVDRLAAEASFIVTTGLIAPHKAAGFSGGRKSIVPGVAGIETLHIHHSLPIRPFEPALGWFEENPFHKVALEAARRVNVRFILNAVQDTQKQNIAFVAGELDEAHCAGVRICREHNTVECDRRADVIIASPGGAPRDCNLYQTQKAIDIIKHTFQDELRASLNLVRATAPLFVTAESGLNDDLNGVERPVQFDIPAAKCEAQVVHSLAKWKRMALWQYDFYPGKGIYTDMNAIRRDEDLDNLHSIYVDQWDWEKVLLPGTRNEQTLRETVQSIVGCIVRTLDSVKEHYPVVNTELCPEVTFISSQELEDLYPGLTPKERENAFVKEHKTVFLSQIGGALKSGKPHDGRAPDYDDWTLNGDILFWHETLGCALEISSMGIRVDSAAMDRQLTLAGCDYRRKFPFHQMVLDGTLPLTMGGGIGQSRLCMLLLGKAHIGEVQASIWGRDTWEKCKHSSIALL